MFGRFSSSLVVGLRSYSWPAVLVGIVVLKAFLSLAIKPGSGVAAYSSIIYFLLLLLAAGFAARNGVQNTLGARPFWVFLAIADGLWALDQWVHLYYDLGLHIDVPDNSIADPVLFLHVVPLIAAAAALPHRNTSERRVHPATLNFLFLLFFWSFLYGYTVLPYQYLLPNATSYALRFDILYLLVNLVLVSAVSYLILRSHPPWKSIYLNLLGASALYALSSTVANLAIDSGGYVSGKLYGLGLTASVCWFVWIPLRARRLTEAEASATRTDGSPDSLASVWAMVGVVVISIPIMWQLFQGHENPALQTLRLIVAIVALVGLASAAFIREYLAKRELASGIDLAHDRLHLAMESSKAVGWDWDVKSGQDVFFGDLNTVFGIPSDHYVGRVEDFIRRVHPDDRGPLWSAVNAAKQSRQMYGAECRILRPDGTVRCIATQGKFYYAVNGEPERMLGMAIDITERKRAEQELRESEDRYRSLVEALPDAVFVLSEDRIVFVNPSGVRLLGAERPEQIVGKTWSAIVHPDSQASIKRRELDSRRMGVAAPPMEHLLIALDGSSVEIESVAIPIAWKGSPATEVIVRDIRGRKRADESLRLFRTLVDESNDAIYVVDPENLRLIDVNGRACVHLGYSREELLSMSIHDIDPDACARTGRISHELRESGCVIFEAGHRRKDGSTVPVEVSLKLVQLDRSYGVCVARNITERKRADLALRGSEESYRNFVAQSSEGIFRQDLDAPIPVDLPEDELVQRILYGSYLAECNDATVKMHGHSSQQELIGKRLTETLDPNDPRNIKLTQDYVRSGFRVLERESHAVDVLGKPKVFLNSLIGIVDDGKLVRTWGIQRDVTERVRLEQAAKQAEQALRESRAELVRAARIATMGELTAWIAHEINQPLAAVAADTSAVLRWLAVRPPNLDEVREAANGAVREANRASRVIERIRALLKNKLPQRRPLDINQVIREVLALAHSELSAAGVGVSTKLAAHVPAVLGDRVQLQQVVLNLIMNAIDAMIEVRDRPRNLLITSATDAEEVLVQIQDSGQGLDPENIHRIFDSFFTTKADGTGMGLSISRSIIEAHGGRLRASPGSPHGAVFQIGLPKAGSNG
jgi:PAS domain S-box-containing protein